MPNILLTTINARYIHASLGLRYLYANMGDLRQYTRICEYTLQQRAIDIVEDLLRHSPAIIGMGVYIWNCRETLEVVRLLKTLHPEVTLVLGGPEVSFETEQQAVFEYADIIITGQADHAFREVCKTLLANGQPSSRIIHADVPELSTLALPYAYYDEDDIANRVLYVEASRGCPFKCEFCLSSLDRTAWAFDLDSFLDAIETLYQRGARHFKFVDRTFNLKVSSSSRILEFFLSKPQQGLFLHFELIPDNLPDELKSLIARFAAGTLQFEIGIQTLNPAIQTRISRKQNNEKAKENIRWLRQHTHAHLHTDLILGLPGETIESIHQGFNDLAALEPHEIQIGILKRLRGTPIIRHTEPYQMRYNPEPPYNILATRDIDFNSMQRLSRLARYWDLIANSGRFPHGLPLILGDNPFAHFLQLSDWIFNTSQQTHRIALPRLFELLYQGMTACLGISQTQAEAALMQDFVLSGIKGKAKFAQQKTTLPPATAGFNRRQRRHV